MASTEWIPERSARSFNALRLSRAARQVMGQNAAVLRTFEALDLNGDKTLDSLEIEEFMTAAAKSLNLEVDPLLINAAVDALLDDVDAEPPATDNDDATAHVRCITKEQFKDIFKRHPSLLRLFDDEVSIATRRQSVISRLTKKEELLKEATENAQVWEQARVHWKKKYRTLMWLTLYFLANIVTFAYKGVKYSNDDEAQAVFGHCIVVARGSAQCLNLNVFIILLPMCRHLITNMRTIGRLRFWIPFDDILDFHMLVGLVIAFFATIHVFAHVCDFYRFVRADEDDILDLVGTKLGDIPESKFDRWVLLLTQPAAITGIIMVVCMVIAYATILGRRTRFNTFWYTHHLLLVMIVCLCFHGISNLLEPFQSVYWVAAPLLIYLIPRIFRQTKYTTCKVLDIAFKGGKVVGLKLVKPASWNKRVKAGMYAFVNIPEVSITEWHPFTLTSAPHEDFIEFHFCQAGDWTSNVHTLFNDFIVDTSMTTERTEGNTNKVDEPKRQLHDLIVKIDGPIGASSQGFSDYPILVLVGAGIGVTPMISVVKQLLKEPGKMKRTFFFWTVRDRASFNWFRTLMDEIYASDLEHVLQVHQFLTSMKDDDRDVGAILLHHAARAKHKRTGFDLFVGHKSKHQLEVGRPNWSEELSTVRAVAKELGHKKCGIFLCGPQKMGEEISEVSFNLSVEDPSFKFSFKKETF